MKTTRRMFMGVSAAAVMGPTVQAANAAGDGVTDDTAALQAAADAGGLVELQPGTYRISKPLLFDMTRSGYSGIRGPQGAARLIMAGAGPAIRIVGEHQGTANPDSVQDHTWERERFPVISGFEILGAHPEADGIELQNTMQAVIDRVLIRKCRYGIHLVVRNRNVIIANCHIYENTDSGIFMDNVDLHQINIIGNHISYCAHAGIRQLDGDVHNVQITGNDIEYNAGYTEGLSAEILLEAPNGGIISEYTIASNTIQAIPADAGANVAIVRADDDRSVGIFSITGNILGSRDRNIYVRNARSSMTIGSNVIYTGVDANVVLEQCANIVMSGNTFRPSGLFGPNFQDRCGIRLDDCSRCSINGNIILGPGDGGPDSGGAISLRRSSSTAILGNQMMHTPYRGVYLEDCRQCRVAMNTILPPEDGTEFQAEVTEAGQCEMNHISGNTL